MLFEDIKEWCEKPQNNFKYEVGKEWCDCVDYTDYINVFLKEGYYFTIYHLDSGKFACQLYGGKSLICRMENINDIYDIIDLLGEYDLL